MLEKLKEGEKTNSKMSGFNWVINSASALWEVQKLIELKLKSYRKCEQQMFLCQTLVTVILKIP